MQDKWICIKEVSINDKYKITYNVGDIIRYSLYEYILEQLIEEALYMEWQQEALLISKLRTEGKDLLNDFCGVCLHPYDLEKIWFDYDIMRSAFEPLSAIRQRQIDSIFLDDFEDLFKK